MPELPEVEVLVRHLRPLVKGQTVRGVEVRRQKVISPTSERALTRTLRGARFDELTRRGKYLVFTFLPAKGQKGITLVGHLGMSGRFFLAPKATELPKHAAVVVDLGQRNLVFEDTRYFGRFTLDTSPLEALGPEPLGTEFSAEYFAEALSKSSQPIKVKLLDQTLVAGVGNIYASEALFRAGISPKLKANQLSRVQVQRLRQSIRDVLREAIRLGSTVPLDFVGNGKSDGLFYYGTSADSSEFYEERLRVYDREGQPCSKCSETIKRFVQAARSTYFCPSCQAD